MKPTNSLYDIRLQMVRKGGESERALALALGLLDPDNRAKIMAAFPEIITKYDALATIELAIEKGLERAE